MTKGLAAAASVCRVKVFAYEDGNAQVFQDGTPNFSLGSGWLITPSLLLTAWHVITMSRRVDRPEMVDVRLQAANLVCEFDFEQGNASGVRVRGSRLLAWNDESDLALVRLAGETGRLGLQVRNPDSLESADDRISMIQHPLATHKLVALRGQRYSLESLDLPTPPPEHLRLEQRMLYDLPTAFGSSGAPIFDDDWNIVGLHIGFVRLDAPGERGLQRFGFGTGAESIRQFLDGTHAEPDDQQLFQVALKEIQARRKEA
jgi:endonuclease G